MKLAFYFWKNTHFTKENEIRWNDDFKSQIHYSHGKSNPCGVLIDFYGSLSLICKISAIRLVKAACIFLIFLIVPVHISMECETQES